MRNFASTEMLSITPNVAWLRNVPVALKANWLQNADLAPKADQMQCAARTLGLLPMIFLFLAHQLQIQTNNGPCHEPRYFYLTLLRRIHVINLVLQLDI